MMLQTALLTFLYFGLAIAVLLAARATGQTPIPANSAACESGNISAEQLGAVAGKQYQGDGLAVIPAPDGARLRCVFQRIEGHVTPEGLWLTSTAEDSAGERFRVLAVAVGRAAISDLGDPSTLSIPMNRAVEVGRVTPCAPGRDSLSSGAHAATRPTGMLMELFHAGAVEVGDNFARFSRAGLTEEYSVSVDGVRQDLIVEQRPEGEGELRVELDVTGAKAEPLVNGARLVLHGLRSQACIQPPARDGCPRTGTDCAYGSDRCTAAGRGGR